MTNRNRLYSASDFSWRENLSNDYRLIVPPIVVKTETNGLRCLEGAAFKDKENKLGITSRLVRKS
jgi:hypothetical protein